MLKKATSEESKGQEKLKATKAFMCSIHSRYKDEHCINGKDDGKEYEEARGLSVPC